MPQASMLRPRTLRPSQPSLLGALLLCAVLLVSQGLGLWHRVAHAQSGNAPLALTLAGTAVQAADFAGHAENSALCQLFDQLCHGNGLTSQPLDFTAAAPQGLQTLIRLATVQAAPLWRMPARAPPALG